ncbi:MAG: DnaA N-terminal domain-containing protein [Alphaproteobacteria bacterium]
MALAVAGGDGGDGASTRKKAPKTVAEIFGERKFQLIEAAARDAELTCFAFRVFVALIAHANRSTWEMNPGAERLRAAIHGKNVRSVQHALIQIRKRGYVELVKQGGRYGGDDPKRQGSGIPGVYRLAGMPGTGIGQCPITGTGQCDTPHSPVKNTGTGQFAKPGRLNQEAGAPARAREEAAHADAPRAAAPDPAASGAGGEWLAVKDVLARHLETAAMSSWIERLGLVCRDAATVTLSAPSRFIKDWVATNFGDHLLDAWRAVVPMVEHVEITAPPKKRGPRQ